MFVEQWLELTLFALVMGMESQDSKQLRPMVTASKDDGFSVKWTGSKNATLDRFPGCKRLLTLGLLSGLASVVALPVELQTDYAYSSLDLPGDFNKALNLSEAFAHGMGAAVILLTAWLVSKHRRKAIWVAALLTITSGLLANGMKTLFVRIRPHAAEQFTLSDIPPISIAIPPTRDVQQSSLIAVQWSYWDSRQRSFPSGHAAVATSLAIGLSMVFPRGTGMFILLGGMACLQRIASGAHFPSDVLAGAAIAFLCSSLILWILARGRQRGALGNGQAESS